MMICEFTHQECTKFALVEGKPECMSRTGADCPGNTEEDRIVCEWAEQRMAMDGATT